MEPLLAFLQTGDGAQRGGLARAVRSDQRDGLALLHFKGDTLYRFDRAVGHVQILYLKH